MKFFFEPNSGAQNLQISGENFKHLKARRAQIGDIINLRNLSDHKNYEYEITALDRVAQLNLVGQSANKSETLYLKLAWAVIDEASVEKTLPFLNELGVREIFFVYSDFSQRNVKFDFARFERILRRSSEQCGRDSVVEFGLFNSSDELANSGLDVILIDFGGDEFGAEFSQNSVFFIGPEGGFSKRERELFPRKFALRSEFTLKSVTAVLATASKVLA